MSKDGYALELKKFENERLKILKKFYVHAFLWFVVLPIIAIGFILFKTNLEMVNILCLAPIILINYIIFFNWYKNKWNKDFITIIKRKIKSKFLIQYKNIRWIINDNFGYKNSDIIPNSELDRSGLFYSFERRNIDDEFEGTYKNVPFKISETELIKLVSDGRRTQHVPIFKGIIVNFKINKKVKNRTIIAPKWSSHQKNNYIVKNILIGMIVVAALFYILCSGHSGERLVYDIIISIIMSTGIIIYLNYCWKKPAEPLNKVVLEDAIFMKKYDVYSSDQVEARYLITSSFMERFLNLKTAFKAKNIKCSFYDDKLMITFDTKKDFFEIGNLFISFNNPIFTKKIISEIESIYNMIDYFKLDEKTKL